MKFVSPPFDVALQSRLLALNNDHSEELSFQTPTRFDALIASASVVRAEIDGQALLIAFHDSCIYDNPNFRWLKSHFDRFIYIDRVVVSSAARGRGLATRLYGMLEVMAREDGSERLVCEINAIPANPQSDQFHMKRGFAPVGEQMLADRGKSVRYWAKELS